MQYVLPYETPDGVIHYSGAFTLMSGDTLTVEAGAEDTGSLIGSGAHETVLAGGVASGDTISGSEQVQSGAFAENFNDYGVEQVQAGAFVENFTVQAGGVLSGLGAIEGLAGDGDYQAGSNVDDGSVRALSITGAAGLAIGSGGNASGLVISALDRNDLGFGRGLFVSAGGVAVNTKIGAGGTVGLRGGNLSNTTVLSGGILVNQSGGELLGTTMNAGTVSSAMIAGSLTVQSNGVDIFDTVLSGAVESVLAGGVTENFTVLKGGTLSGSGFITGLAGDGDYQAGYNIDDGNLNGLAITGAAGLAVASGGVATGLLVSALDRTDLGFGRGLFVSSGGSVINTEVALSGTLGLRGGLATNTTVLFGGIVVEESGGRLRGNTVNAGVVSNCQIAGTMTVQSGGVDNGDTLLAAAVETVQAGAVTENFTIAAGAVLSGPGFISGLAGDGVLPGSASTSMTAW